MEESHFATHDLKSRLRPYHFSLLTFGSGVFSSYSRHTSLVPFLIVPLGGIIGGIEDCMKSGFPYREKPYSDILLNIIIKLYIIGFIIEKYLT